MAAHLGRHTPHLILANAQPDLEGDYSVVVSNPWAR